MHSDDLPPVLLSQRRYQANTSIPEGKVLQHSLSEIPMVSRRGSAKINPLSMRDIMTDQRYIDQKLKSLSSARESELRMSLQEGKKQRANLKFLKYKFNPNTNQQSYGDSLRKEHGNQQAYGQLGGGTKQKISINVFYERRNVLFQDERAPLVYKKLFIEREQNI